MFLYLMETAEQMIHKWSQRPLSSYISSRKELVEDDISAAGPSGNAVDPNIARSHSLSLCSLISPARVQ